MEQIISGTHTLEVTSNPAILQGNWNKEGVCTVLFSNELATDFAGQWLWAFLCVCDSAGDEIFAWCAVRWMRVFSEL